MEDEEKVDEDRSMDGREVGFYEIDSSKTIEEETGDLILQRPTNLTDQREAGLDNDDDDVIIGAHVERYTGHCFLSRMATNEWMAWDATSSM